MKQNNGFTLIELLAVIVILAVIALIATPIIMNVINDSKKGADKDSIYGYIKAVELATTQDITTSNNGASGIYEVDSNGNLKQGDKIISIAYKGTTPSGSLLLSAGQVLVSNLSINGNLYGIDSAGEVTLVKPSTYALGQEIYFNPYTGKTCSSSDIWTNSNTSSQCFKWNVITTNDNDKQTSIEMLLDHNLLLAVRWTLADTNIGGPTELVKTLKQVTGEWKNTLHHGNITEEAVFENHYTVDYTGAKARIITAEEVVTMTGTIWNQNNNASINNLENFKWLFSNLGNTVSYWTTSAHRLEANRAWYLYYEDTPKYLLSTSGRGGIESAVNAGLRPVVRVLKSTIQ